MSRGCVVKSTAEILQHIESRRNSFFTAIKGTTLPLLGGNEGFYQKFKAVGSVRAYKVLKSQPPGLRATLKPYQLQGLSFLVHLRNNGVGGILGDEMGLGKTLQTLALFQFINVYDSAVRSDRPGPFLVVCPFSVMDTWLSEISKWTPELTSIKFHGTPSKKGEVKRILTATKKNQRLNDLDPVVDIVITSYETLVSDIRWFRKFIWRYVVLDEGHRIKNNQSHRAHAIQSIRAEYKLILTGTPVQNNLRELWSVFHWLYPEVFVPSTAKSFEEAFSLSEGKFDPSFFEQVQKFLGLVMLRRVKDSPEVGLSIPPKTETVLSVPLSEFQRSLYLRILTGIENTILDGRGSSGERRSRKRTHQQSGMVFKESGHDSTDGPSRLSAKNLGAKKYRVLSNTLMELRKCSIHPYLLEDAVPDPYELGEHVIINSGKYIVLLKMIQHFVLARKKKVIIFSNFMQALNLCEDLLSTIQRSGDSARYVRLDGSTSAAWRNLSTYLFEKDPRYMVFLISIRAGGEGLNLVSSSTVIFLDEDWNPQVMRQAEARVHRIGQKSPVNIFKLQSKGTVEEQISRRIVKKAYVASKVMEDMHAAHDAYALGNMNNSQGFASAMDAEDLSALIYSRAVLTSEKLSATKLSWFDWNTILHICEKAWLARTERVKTNIFDGKRIDTRFRSFSTYEVLPEDLCRADRRIGKERTVIIDGFSVGKDSIRLEALSCKKKSSNLPQADSKNKMRHEASLSIGLPQRVSCAGTQDVLQWTEVCMSPSPLFTV
ncbi:SNF2 family N-terminal domain-containing protein [Aspergillus coremiiformis]|uniref:SNF2 family N-terminal domain-containing protein n=1 Tax=Aspergillus coremiiformis TaxID=138285 RepID=A0A5N6YY80_9EURO|nr:SNF2 family N-terminal domain-containing protein [Aspergillus coremiiformis]